MLVNGSNLDGLFRGFNTSFNTGFTGAKSYYSDVAMVQPSSTRELTYGWLGQFPALREWVGDRIVQGLVAHSYTIANKTFETTIEVKRTDIEDDTYGVYAPLFQEMGRSAAENPDRLIFNLLNGGFNTKCYDGQYFFDTDHPVLDESGEPTSVSNMQAGAGAPWFLVDTSRAIRPLIFQERLAYSLQRVDMDTHERVFMTDTFLYGVRARANAGYGLWQLAFGSKAPLTKDAYRDARAAMSALRGDQGRPLGIQPDTLIVPSSHEEAALQILNATHDAAGASNVWANTAKLIVTPWLV